MLGMLASESQLRQSNYIRRGGCNAFISGQPTSHPLSVWTEEDLGYYIRRYKVPCCNIYGMGLTRTGCALCGFGCTLKNDQRFKILYELYPGIYRMCMEFQNSGYTYRQVLKMLGVRLPDE